MTVGATGSVRWLLRFEGLAMLLGAGLMYRALGGNGWIFALCFFLPDLAFLGYLGGARIGAGVYNLAHTYVGPMICLLLGWLLPEPSWMLAGLIWGAHIGFDRALGYGLKYPTGFGHTHLGAIGIAGTPGQKATERPPTG